MCHRGYRRQMITTEYDIRRYVDKYGQKYEKLIRDSLSYLDERIPIWSIDIDIDIDKDRFIAGLIKRVSKRKNEYKRT